MKYYICMTKQIEPQHVKTWTHRADNRERLIAAGYTVLSEKGYEATTVKEVAHVAGVSPRASLGGERRAQALAAVILAGIDGLALQQLAQPDEDFTDAYNLLLAVILAGNAPTA